MEMTLEYTRAEDNELITGILGRIPEALDRLHQRYRRMIKSVIMQVLHDDAEADDVLQDVLIQIWNRAESYSSEKGKLVSWICTLARRRAIDRLRHHSAYSRATDRFEVLCSQQGEDFDQTHTVERDTCRADLRDLLVRQLNTLPPPQEEVLRLAFFEDKSQREIAELTKTPLGTVKTRIELGLRKLSHAIGQMKEKIS
jgi:RNA polymerase sigma-70 factor (ECF subfamily)